MKMRLVLTFFLCTAVSAACGSQVINSVTGQTERSVTSEQDEMVERRKAHQQVLQGYDVQANLALQAYVNDLGQRLAKQSHRASLTRSFTVLDSPEINAFALPGGYFDLIRQIA